jgi:valyl-tRNA synthetase
LKREVFPAPFTPITPRRSPSFIAKEISFNITSVPKERLISDADKAIIYIPLAEIIDFEKEITRWEEEKKKLLSEIERIDKKLANKGFVAKAPAAVIEGEKKKRVGYADKLASVEASLAKYKK